MADPGEPGTRCYFVTGKLAEGALRRELAALTPRVNFHAEVAVLPISVAALLTTPWIARHWRPPADAANVLLPGLTQGDTEELARQWQVPVQLGPKDLRDLPEHFGEPDREPGDFGAYDIEILAELNHARRLTTDEMVAVARRLVADGADVIDLGCDPGSTWCEVGDAVRRLRDQGMRVSIDSFNPAEVALATRAGAELVLSVNSSNAFAASDWGVEVVAVPDNPSTGDGLDATINRLEKAGVRFRIDPVLEPIGFGFAASLGRYIDGRRRYPQAEMLMGVGNLTELTSVDSAGINVVLAGLCQELGIRSVLTTQVINWCQSCVGELDLARRLVRYAVVERSLPKRISDDLVMLRDPKTHTLGEAGLRDLASRVADRNYRLFAEGGTLHAINGSMHLHGDDPFTIFEEMSLRDEKMDPSHAFYLGYEMAKAVTALTLGKDYVQDEPLRWGFLTRDEKSRHR